MFGGGRGIAKGLFLGSDHSRRMDVSPTRVITGMFIVFQGDGLTLGHPNRLIRTHHKVRLAEYLLTDIDWTQQSRFTCACRDTGDMLSVKNEPENRSLVGSAA